MIVFKSVKFRLTLWYAIILAIFLSFFAFFMVAELSRVLYRDIDRNLYYEIKAIEESLSGHLSSSLQNQKEIDKIQFPNEPLEYPVLLKEKLIEALQDWEHSTRRLSRSTTLMRLVGFDHTVLLSNVSGWGVDIIFPNFERDPSFMEKGNSYQTIHFQKRPIRLYYHLMRFKNKPILIIQSAISTHEVKSTLQRLNFIILVSIPITVTFACVAGWLFVKRSFGPVDDMIKEARQITAAYLKGRLPRTHTRDELDRLAETLNEMMDRIENSTRAIQDFSSDVSHELKTPLAIIRGEIDLALRKTRSTEDLLQTLRTIEGEVNELIRLVDDLMLLVRSDAKQLRFEKKKIFLDELLGQAIDRFQDRAAQKKIQISHHLIKDVRVEGDEIYLKRLFFNLLDNSIKFTPQLGKIWVDMKLAANKVMVSIKDTGIGIPLEMQAKVFSRFYRTDQGRSYDGAGLGLNIAKAITDAHSGQISLTSYPDQGTEITITLPLI